MKKKRVGEHNYFLTETDIQIFNILKNGSSFQREIQLKTKIGSQHIKNRLDFLERYDLIKREINKGRKISIFLVEDKRFFIEEAVRIFKKLIITNR